jgi:multidrug efflux pump subunit AcrA (membrane-fusion protein)
VPRAAVRREGDADVVYAVAGGRAERRAVRLGPGGTAGTGDWIEVLAGVASGERVVVEGPVDLADGDPVSVRAEAG